jgi:hypothetical protein
MARVRGKETDRTVRRRVDVARAFDETEEESPTKPTAINLDLLRESGAHRVPTGAESVEPLVPLDAVPVLNVPRTSVPWADLGDLATQLMLRVDGATCTMRIVTGTCATPNEGARELGCLARRGLVRLVLPSEDDDATDSDGSSVAQSA